VLLDFNAGFDKVFNEEDQTEEDDYPRANRHNRIRNTNSFSRSAITAAPRIQNDPLTSEILRSRIFIVARDLDEGELDEQNDRLRYIVAHEVGPRARALAQFREGSTHDDHEPLPVE
jgi:hypothetical protein